MKKSLYFLILALTPSCSEGDSDSEALDADNRAHY